MNRKKIIIALLVTSIIVGIYFSLKYIPTKNDNTEKEETENWKKDSSMYKEDASLEELKKEYKLTGQDDLYEIQTEYDGRKVAVIKPDINYKVAFAGMIKDSIPDFSEIDEIFDVQYPQNQSGVWINKNDRKKVLEFLNDNELLKNEYYIDDNGFLKVISKNNSTDLDNKINKIIDTQNTYIIAISGICYMVDPVTGEIVKDPFEDIGHGQVYEYFENEYGKIIFITENLEKELTNDEILESIIKLLIN